jgi:plastocyanin
MLLVGALAACGGGTSPDSRPDPTGSGGAAIAIQTFAFTPATVTVPAGSVVIWMNEDSILHTATSGTPGSPSGVFDGAMDGKGATFSFRFTEPGTYRYFCSRHEVMRGTVTVT